MYPAVLTDLSFSGLGHILSHFIYIRISVLIISLQETKHTPNINSHVTCYSPRCREFVKHGTSNRKCRIQAWTFNAVARLSFNVCYLVMQEILTHPQRGIDSAHFPFFFLLIFISALWMIVPILEAG